MKRRRFPLGRALPVVSALLPLLLLWPVLRVFIEARMSLHMLVEFPVLVAAGWSANTLFERHRTLSFVPRMFANIDWEGWTGATLTSCVAIIWMIPAALDASLLDGAVAVAKYASWWIAGWCLRGSWNRMSPELRLFFLGNLGWMTATAGLLYLDAPVRLCANYLEDDQRRTAFGLLALALILGSIALHHALRQDVIDGRTRIAPDPEA